MQNSNGSVPDNYIILHHPEGFDFVPANRRLSAVEVGLVNVMSRETVLKRYLEGIKGNYDYVLLDCRPSLGMLVINALSASDYVLIPVQADYLAAEDMTELVGTVQSIRQQINPKLKIGGVFLTMANDTNFRRDIVAGVKENFGKYLPVLEAVIPSTVRLAEISTADKSIFRHEPNGRAARAYGTLVKEVEHIGEKQRIRPADIARYNSLPNTQVRALLKSPSPLADVFAAWEDRETSYMEEIWQTVTGRAKEETQKFRNAQKER